MLIVGLIHFLFVTLGTAGLIALYFVCRWSALLLAESVVVVVAMRRRRLNRLARQSTPLGGAKTPDVWPG